MINGAWFGRSIEHTIPRSLSSWTCSIVAWNPSYEQFARTLAVWLHPSELVQDLPTYGPSIEVPEYGGGMDRVLLKLIELEANRGKGYAVSVLIGDFDIYEPRNHECIT